MTASASEAFLKTLAEKTFLKLWAISNPFYKAGTEMTDLVIPFADDIIIVSDKSSTFDDKVPVELAWSRWRRRALDGSLHQLAGAMRTVSQSPETVFLDAKVTTPPALPLGPAGTKRLHLVAIARPDRDPEVVPGNWPGLTYVPDAQGRPFHVGKIERKGAIIHAFDGPTINLLLETLDTAPDFLAYLKGREAALREGGDYEFLEMDLLAAAMIGWDDDTRGLPSVPPLEAVVPRLWDHYVDSGRHQARKSADRPSRIIDNYINQQHEEFAAGRFLQHTPTYEQHEQAMRLLAAESRFARRMIAHELYDILNEDDQTTFWASTVPSFTRSDLRYLWVTYPKRPGGVGQEDYDRFVMHHLQEHVLVARAHFGHPLILAIAFPNPKAGDTALFTLLFGGEWTAEDHAQALEIQARGVFAKPEAQERVHIP
jgi:hypothetical protein